MTRRERGEGQHDQRRQNEIDSREGEIAPEPLRFDAGEDHGQRGGGSQPLGDEQGGEPETDSEALVKEKVLHASDYVGSPADCQGRLPLLHESRSTDSVPP